MVGGRHGFAGRPYQISDDGRLLAYTRREAGSDWTTIRVLEVDSGAETGDVLHWTRWGNIVWNAAGDGFYYSRYPEPEEGAKHQSVVTNQAIYFHRLGQEQSEDTLVFRQPGPADVGVLAGTHRRRSVPRALDRA